MPDLTNQQLLEAIRKEFATKDYLDERLESFATKDDLKQFATKDDIKATRSDIARLERKLDDHKLISTQHHLRILESIGALNQQFIKLSESQEGLGKRFNKLRIVTE